LTKVFYDISSKLYQSADQAGQNANQDFNQQQTAGQTGQSKNEKDEKVVDADYKVMDDDKK
jgi:molecular chaperone DnaK